MAQYTQSIREILQEAKTDREDLRSITDVYNIALRTLFAHAPLAVISQEYLQQFVTGFTLHFFNDELALETLPLWQIALNEKLYNSASYINAIFDNLDKQVFSEYNVEQKENSTDMIASVSEELNATSNDTRDVERAGSEANQRTEENENSLYGHVKKTGDVDHSKEGYDELIQSGNISNDESYAEQLNQGGNVETVLSGADEYEQTGERVSEHGGEDTVTNGLTVNTENKGGLVTDKYNGIGIQFDTPQGSLSNMRTPGGDATGQGVAYATENVEGVTPPTAKQTYQYMSGASENDNTNVHEDLSKQEVKNSGDDVTKYDSTTTQSFVDAIDYTRYGKTSTETRALEDDKSGAKNNVQEFDKSDKTEYNSSQKDTYNTTDTTNNTVTENKDIVESKATEDTERLVGTGENHSEKSGANESNTTSSGNNTGYKMTYEMLYRSIPLLKKVWELFDDLFFILL